MTFIYDNMIIFIQNKLVSCIIFLKFTAYAECLFVSALSFESIQKKGKQLFLFTKIGNIYQHKRDIHIHPPTHAHTHTHNKVIENFFLAYSVNAFQR